MLTDKDREVLELVCVATESGQLQWDADNQADFKASYKGKFKLGLDFGVDDWGNDVKRFRMWRGDETLLLEIMEKEDVRVARLYDAARRSALKVDADLDALIGDFRKELHL